MRAIHVMPREGGWEIREAVQRVHGLTAGHEGDAAYSSRVGAACDEVATQMGLDSDEIYEKVMIGLG
jgi:hypothetical protein